MTELSFKNKAQTLEMLEKQVSYSTVLPQIRFNVKQWLDSGRNIDDILKQSSPQWMNSAVIVRSSSILEDSDENSLAGHFTTIANVTGVEAINDAIEKVIASFESSDEKNLIFIQPFLNVVSISGVAFTRDPSINGHYYVINYDDHSGSTDSVTSGSSNNLKTYYLSKTHPELADAMWLNKLIAQLTELEELFECEALDVEFAFSRDDTLYLLQVRPLVFKQEPLLSLNEQLDVLNRISDRIKILGDKHPYLHGKKSIFGVMPDWNPAEIIGIRPRPLALSLYKELVTDGTWAFQRNNYGYKNLRSFPLVVSFGGCPYVDIRVSFNSFIPQDSRHELAEKLVDYYIQQLTDKPSYHDKVEFEIIFSCYTFDIEDRIQVLHDNAFTPDECNELKESLLQLTNNIINNENGLWTVDSNKLDELKRRQQVIMSSDLPRLEKIYWLIEDCKRYGTLPFAGLARAGFIAVQLLKSLVTVDVLSSRDYDDFMRSLITVSSAMSIDFDLQSQNMFLEKYGHLRPGTYDILSPRYDDDPDRYFDWSQQNTTRSDEEFDFGFSLPKLNKINKLLAEHGINHDVVSLFNFIKGAIEGREYAKFVFTKSLSDCLRLLGDLGREYKYSSDDISYVDYSVIKNLYSCSSAVSEVLAENIKSGRADYQITQSVRMPPLITRRSDVVSFEMPEMAPNFITQKSVVAEVISDLSGGASLAGKIVLIPSADPGFDWIFTKNISGFVTMYGGANSHMAIRANELGLPAIVGVGEAEYNCLLNAKLLEIDCANNHLRILQ